MRSYVTSLRVELVVEDEAGGREEAVYEVGELVDAAVVALVELVALVGALAVVSADATEQAVTLEGGEGLVEGALIGAHALGGAKTGRLGRGGLAAWAAGGRGRGSSAEGGFLAWAAGGGDLGQVVVVGIVGLAARGERFVDHAFIEAEPGGLALAFFGDVAEELREAEGIGGLAGFEQAHAAIGADEAGVGGLLARGQLEDVGDAELALARGGRPVGARPAAQAQFEVRAKLLLEEALLLGEVPGEPGELVRRFVGEHGALLDEHAADTPRQLLLALPGVGRHCSGSP